MTSVPSIETPRGRTEISSRAMTRLVSAVAAEALGVQPSQVSVDLDDADGGLDLTVRAPLRERPEAPAGGGEDDPSGSPQTREYIRRTVSELSGGRINEVSIRRTRPLLRLPRRGD